MLCLYAYLAYSVQVRLARRRQHSRRAVETPPWQPQRRCAKRLSSLENISVDEPVCCSHSPSASSPTFSCRPCSSPPWLTSRWTTCWFALFNASTTLLLYAFYVLFFRSFIPTSYNHFASLLFFH